MRIEYMNKRKKELNLSNAKISELSGVPMSTLSKIMAGIIKNPKLNTLQAIAKVLECTIDDFYEKGSDNKKNPETTNVSSTFIISELEKRLIIEYRNAPQMHEAIHRLLGIE